MDQAMAQLRKISPASKLYSDAVLHVGYLLKQAHQLDDAKKYMRDAISKAPEMMNFYLFEASIEEELKDLPGAIDMLQGALKRFPDDEKILYYLGSLYDRQGDADKGVEEMREILRINPENVDALNYVGYTWTQRGVHLDEAGKLLKRAMSIKPDNGYVADSWGWYLLVRGRLTEAVIELEKAAHLKPTEATILDHLGDAYLRSNLEEKALAKYTDALKYVEDEETRKKISEKVESLRQEMVAKGKAPVVSDLGRAPAQSGERDETPIDHSTGN